MSISPVSAVTTLVTPIRSGSADPAPPVVANANGGNASQAPSGSSATITSIAVKAPVASPPAEAVLPDPGPFVIAPAEPAPVSEPPKAPVNSDKSQAGVTTPEALAASTAFAGQGASKRESINSSGSTVVLKPNEIPPSEDMQALIDARKRAEVLQDSLAMKQLIASLEMAVATELPISKASNVTQEPNTTEDANSVESVGAAPSMTDPEPDQKVDLRY